MEVWVILNTWKNKRNVSSAVYLYSTKEEAVKWFNHYVDTTKFRLRKEIASKKYSYDKVSDYLFSIQDDKDEYYEEFYLTDRIVE